MRRSDFGFIIKLFLSWRGLLFAFAFLATLIIPNFGNRFPYADRVLITTGLPSWIWGFGNFDGVHYLRLAQNGYTADYTQAFFPLYSLFIRLFNFFPKNQLLDPRFYTDPSYFASGMILSAVFFVAALFFLYKLLVKEYDRKIAKLSLLLLLSFPTAFYFGAVYSESLLLLLAVLTFWFASRDKFLSAGVTAALASATKIQGILLFVFLIAELFEKKKISLNKILGAAMAPLGLVFYTLFLKRTTGDFFYFLASQPAFGATRSSFPFVLLPQVIYRYVKIFLAVSPTSLAFATAALEFLITGILIVILIAAFKKMKFSYWLFSALAVLLPTLTGTLSSMPRYSLLAFMVLPYLAARYKKKIKYIVIVQSALQIILLSFFIRGYWVA